MSDAEGRPRIDEIADDSSRFLIEIRTMAAVFDAELRRLQADGATVPEREQFDGVIEDMHGIGRIVTRLAVTGGKADIPLYQKEEMYTVDSTEAYECMRDFVNAKDSGEAFNLRELKDHLEALNVVLPSSDATLMRWFTRWQAELVEERIEAGEPHPQWHQVYLRQGPGNPKYFALISKIPRNYAVSDQPVAEAGHAIEDAGLPFAERYEWPALELFYQRREELGRKSLRRGPLINRLAEGHKISEQQAAAVYEELVQKGKLFRTVEAGTILYSTKPSAQSELRPSPVRAEKSEAERNAHDKIQMKHIIDVLFTIYKTEGTSYTEREINERLVASSIITEPIPGTVLRRYVRALLRQNLIAHHQANQRTGGTKFQLSLHKKVYSLMKQPGVGDQIHALIDSGDNFNAQHFTA